MKSRLFFFLISVYFFSSCGKKVETNTASPQPSGNCTYSRDEKDPLGKVIRVVNDEKFISFAFSDSAAKAAYHGDDFLKGYLSCVRVDSVMGIYFDFKINSADAYDYYGMIKKDNTVKFILKSGKEVSIPFGHTFSGNTNLSEEKTEYSSFAVITDETADELKSEELSRVVINWSKRNEDYLAVNPGIFINQIPCIK